MSIARLVVIAALCLSACRQEPPPREFQLTGQILSIKPESQEVLVKHDDIPGFMMAMTMPYKVEDADLLKDKSPGDLITATLVVAETRAWLSTVTRTGHAEIVQPEVQPEVSALDMVKPGEVVPDVTLVNEEGATVQLSSYRGRRLALTFIYTRCPDAEFCPLMNQNFLTVQKAIASTPGLGDVQLLSVSFDPEFDTPSVLKEHARRAQADPKIWRFATGTADDIGPFAARFGVTVTRNGSPALIHNLGTAVIDAQGRLSILHSTNRWTPSDLVAELQAAAASRN
ncbi:MAG: SCO family protein [Vicinamibacterales bacterium]